MGNIKSVRRFQVKLSHGVKMVILLVSFSILFPHTNAQTKLTLLTWYENPIDKSVVEDFTNQGYELEVEVVPFGDYGSLLQIKLASGTMPDLFIVTPDQLSSLVEAAPFLQLNDDVIEQATVEALRNLTIGSYTFDQISRFTDNDQLLALPTSKIDGVGVAAWNGSANLEGATQFLRLLSEKLGQDMEGTVVEIEVTGAELDSVTDAFSIDVNPDGKISYLIVDAGDGTGVMKLLQMEWSFSGNANLPDGETELGDYTLVANDPGSSGGTINLETGEFTLWYSLEFEHPIFSNLGWATPQVYVDENGVLLLDSSNPEFTAKSTASIISEFWPDYEAVAAKCGGYNCQPGEGNIVIELVSF